MNKIALKIFLISILSLMFPGEIFAMDKNFFPKVANLYLNPIISPYNYDSLAKYDLLILDVDAPTSDPAILEKIKEKNPNIKIYAYIPSQSVNDQDLSDWAQFRNRAYNKINENDWWLRDSKGKIINFSSIWPTIKFVDVGNGWSSYLSELAAENMKAQKWDGVFYDMVFTNLEWLNGGDIDLDKNGQPDSRATVNEYWQKGMNELIDKTRKKIDGDVIASVDNLEGYNQVLDGYLIENYPANWFGPDSWKYSTGKYFNLENKGKLNVINSNTENGKILENYKKMRFGLASTLLGDGYYSFDSGDQDHAQTWWYDEYDAHLGKAVSNSYNLLDKENRQVKPGLWRRDFEKGVAIVNSTNVEQKFVFKKEEFEKIRGKQDARVNDGSRINWIKIAANDGLVLLKEDKEIFENSYDNGSFIRLFSNTGSQVRNGFFAYKDSYPGSAQILNSDIDNDGDKEALTNDQGVISVFKNGKKKFSFSPYNGKFKGKISVTAADLNNDGKKEIITGAGQGGGPHIRIFTIDGKPASKGFFAYDKNFRGGVNVAVGDVDGDGQKEIITGAGQGGGPNVRVYKNEKMLSQFLAFDKSVRTGIRVGAQDANGDGIEEILVGNLSY